MNRYLSFFVLIFWTSIACANQTEIKHVRIWPAPENTRVVFDLSKPIDCQVKTLDYSNRVNIELKNTIFKANISKIDFQGSRIKSITSKRINKNDLNIEIELAQPLKPTVFSLTPNQTYGHRLVLDLELGQQAQQNERESILALFEADAPSETDFPSNDRNDRKASNDNKTSNNDKMGVLENETFAAKPSPSPVKVLEHKQTPFIVAIDAGHGGEDPGAIGKKGTREKDVALAIAKQLKILLDKEPNMRGVMIRTGDYYIALHERVQRARRHHADLFLSIHADAFHDKRAEGASVFTLSERGASSAAARWLAEKENRSDLIGGVRLKDKNKVLASVLLDLSQTKSKEEGLKAAQYVLNSMATISVLHRGHVEQAGFAVLKAPDIPSLLVETGFISNLKGEANLRNPVYQKRVAQAILNGLRNYARKKQH